MFCSENKEIKFQFVVCAELSTLSPQALCPRCEVGNMSCPKRKAKKGKEMSKGSKKKTPRLNTLSDVEKALIESKDSTSTVSVNFSPVSRHLKCCLHSSKRTDSFQPL